MPVLRNLNQWYRWGRRDQWRRALTRRSNTAEWGRAPWKTKVWWFREDFLGTPIKNVVECQEKTREYGGIVARQYGISIARQVAEQVWLRLRYGISSHMYYTFRLFLPHMRRQAQEFVTGHKIVTLNRQLNRRACPEEAAVLKDKLRFATWCTAHGIPTVPVLASFKDGTMTPHVWDGGEAPLPRRDLFSKNADQWWGLESTRWRHVGQGRYDGGDGVVDQEGLLGILKERSQEMALILQECYANHASIARLSSGGLCTVRLVTGRLPGGEPTPFFASFRMPTGGAIADNFLAGGIAAPVDLETGRLGSAVSEHPRPGPPRYAAHPDTGHPIAGFQLPRWDEIVELGLETHRAFPETPSVGWDIALTERGLLVLEGNEEWSADLIEIPHERPLTDTLFQPYYDAWMRHCLEAESAQNMR